MLRRLSKSAKIPYYGVMALAFPEQGEHIAALGELTGVQAIKRMRDKLKESPRGRRIHSA